MFRTTQAKTVTETQTSQRIKVIERVHDTQQRQPKRKANVLHNTQARQKNMLLKQRNTETAFEIKAGFGHLSSSRWPAADCASCRGLHTVKTQCETHERKNKAHQ